jgi:hypothetical protein
MGFTNADSPATGTPAATTAILREPTPQQLRAYIVKNVESDREAVEAAVAEQQDQFPFLTEIAAYYLVAQGHGLQPADVFETVQRDFSLEIEALEPEMNSVDLTATVKQITTINTFQKDGGQGKVCNVILTDDSAGTATLTLWDEQTSAVDELAPGDAVRIENGYSKTASDYCQDRFDCTVEVRVGDGELLRQEQSEWTSCL